MADPLIADETRPLLADTVYRTRSHSIDNAADEENGRLAGTASPSPSPTLMPGGTDDTESADDPRNWPAGFKWTIVLMLALLAFTVTFTCISVVPFAAHIVDELEGREGGSGFRGAAESNVRAASVLLVTIWELGEAAGPLAIAPLSETATWGRRTVLAAATTLFALATAGAALAPSTTLFIAARGLTGVAVATNVLNPAIVGDLFPPEQRGSAMALVQLTPLMGGAIGPAIGGMLADTWGWRSVLWLSTGLAVACSLLVWLAFRETYGPAIQRARRQRVAKAVLAVAAAAAAAAAREVAENAEDARRGGTEPATPSLPSPPSPATPGVKTAASSSGLRHIRDAVLRPAILLGNSFVLAVLALYGAVLFSYFYVMSVSLPDILENRYGFSSAATGSSFLVFSIGALVSVVVCNHFLDRIYIHLTRTRGRLVLPPQSSSERGAAASDPAPVRVGRPEFKLPLATVCSVMLPTAVAAYGWSAELRLPLPCLFVAEGLIGASMVLTLIPLAAYVVDAFGLFAASAMTGLIVTRCLCSTFLPLTVAPLVDAFGYGWGFMVLAGICLAVAPIPIAVYFYGERWRQLSKYTRDA